MLVEHILILAICGLGVIHGISLGVYLMVTAKTKSSANALLGGLLLLLGLRISKSIFLYFTADLDLQLIMLGLTLILSFGPLFFLYIKRFLDAEFRLRKSHWFHALPLGFFLAGNTVGLLSKEFYVYFGIYFIYFHFLIYIVVAYIWQRKYWASAVDTAQKSKKVWINYLHLGIAFIWVSYFVFLLDDFIPYIVGPITYSLVIYPLSFWAIAKKVLKPDEGKYQNSRLDILESAKIITELETYIQEVRPFLDPNLKLPMVAAQLNITPHVLSQVVNENYQQNFRQFLNTHRIKFAQRLLTLEASAHLTIAAIAYDSGFNSLSAFNAAFKKAVNQTPSQYRKGPLK